MKVRIFLCAQQVIRDSESGHVSAINILTGAEIGDDAALMAPFSMLSQTERESEDPDRLQANLSIFLDDEALMTAPLEVNFADKRLNNMIVKVEGMRIARPGEVRIEVNYAGLASGAYTIPITMKAASSSAE